MTLGTETITEPGAPTMATHHRVDSRSHVVTCPHCGKVAATIAVLVSDSVETPADAERCAANLNAMSLTPIDSYPWPARVRHAFRAEGIKTFGDLCALSRRQLGWMPNIGNHSVETIEQVLASYGLRLRDH